jgi:hypothetical protein
MRAIACLASGLALAFTTASVATPLEKEVCSAFKEEHGQLVGAGVKANMERGPEWAKTNLSPDQIKQIERLINVEEQLAFRCPQPQPPFERADNPDPAAVATGTLGASDPPKRVSPSVAARPLRKAKASRADNPDPAGVAAGAVGASEPPKKRVRSSVTARPLRKAKAPAARAASQTERRPKKTRPRPKASDAYVPPTTKSGEVYLPSPHAPLVTQGLPPAPAFHP